MGQVGRAAVSCRRSSSQAAHQEGKTSRPAGVAVQDDSGAQDTAVHPCRFFSDSRKWDYGVSVVQAGRGVWGERRGKRKEKGEMKEGGLEQEGR